jgi:hypothetical protein
LKKTFVRALILNAIVQFVVTRARAGHAIEEGAAERMWLLYPANVLINAAVWTLMIVVARRMIGVVRR